MARLKGTLSAGAAPARILDVLETDGGWLTCAGLALAIDYSEKSTARALSRLWDRGLLRRRRVELGDTNLGLPAYRMEYHAL